MKKAEKYLLLAVSLLLISACSNKQKTEETTEKTIETTESTIEETYKVVGVESSDAYDILLKNDVGLDIKAITIKQETQSDYPASMLTNDQKIAKSETVKLFYTAENQDAEPKYSCQVTLDDDSVLELSSIDFDNIDGEKAVELLRDDELGILYLKYHGKNGEVVDTKEQELTYKTQKEEAEAAAQAQADAEAAAQAQADAEAAQNAQYSQDTQYNQDASNNGSAPVTQQPTAPAAPAPSNPAPSQDTDGCLTEPEFN